MKPKKLTILWHNGGRLGNQLWLYAHVLAHAKEHGLTVKFPAFFEYAQFFSCGANVFLIDHCFAPLYQWCSHRFRRILFRDPHKNIFRSLYKICVRLVETLYPQDILYAPDSDHPIIQRLEHISPLKPYLHGWLFRATPSLLKHGAFVRSYLQLKHPWTTQPTLLIQSLRATHKHVIGIHVRQGDYLTLPQCASLVFTMQEIKLFIHQFLHAKNWNSTDCIFMFCSDGPLDLSAFQGLATTRSTLTAIEDLSLLSKTDVILGSDSTFGAFASFLGNVPFHIFDRAGVDPATIHASTFFCNTRAKMLSY